MVAATDLRILTVNEYHRMVDAGILAADERVELLGGQLYTMAAKGTAHSAAVTRIDRILSRKLPSQTLIRFQDPIQLSDTSEPEPDVALVLPDPLDYEDHHPRPDEILLIIEVADSTLRRDLDLKAPLYALAGIVEYWVLDLQERQLYVFQDPSATGYRYRQILPETATIAPLMFPECHATVQDFLKPKEIYSRFHTELAQPKS